ncbi:tyrosine-type recombinase/integrase [Thalassobaculum sp.]|uniref:tyrosine-type recombinase/integrase n=1 Tax=Thalassobaculum sp. TaxID=2022740 RepID=UPI003B5A7E04
MPSPLTAKAVEKAKPDPENPKRREIPDGGSGLYLVVQPSGAKSWAARYRNAAGKPVKLTLGKYHEEAFPLSLARQRLRETLDAVDRGIDPAAAKRAAKAAADLVTLPTTMGDLADVYVKRYLKKRVRRWEAAQGEIDNHIRPRLGSVSLVDLSRAHGRQMVQEIAETYPVAANRALARLNAILNWAVGEDLIEANPMVGIKRASAEAPRERVLSDAELREVWQASDTLGYPAGEIVKMLILTGQRRDEVRSAPWSEFNLEERTWIIPTARFKGGRPHMVPLSDAVLERLASMPFKDRAEHVFIGRIKGKPFHNLEKPKAALDKAIAEARGEDSEAMQPWTLHDLRRTCRTGMSRLGIARDVAERVIGHAVGGKLGATYDVYEYRDEKARALSAWGDHVLAVVEGKQSDNVVPMRAGK